MKEEFIKFIGLHTAVHSAYWTKYMLQIGIDNTKVLTSFRFWFISNKSTYSTIPPCVICFRPKYWRHFFLIFYVCAPTRYRHDWYFLYAHLLVIGMFDTGCPNKHGNSVTNLILSLLWISIVIPNFKSHNITMSMC